MEGAHPSAVVSPRLGVCLLLGGTRGWDTVFPAEPHSHADERMVKRTGFVLIDP
jgi:hypothetical protein